MSNRRIIYVLEPFEIPFGGVAAIYNHAEILHAHGLPVFVALPRRPARDFYGVDVPLLIHDGRLSDHAREGDIFVLPESFSEAAKTLLGTPTKRLMFCQNQHLLAFSERPELGTAELNVDGVIASSQSVREFFRDVYAIEDVPLLPYAIDRRRFKPASSKMRQIAYMPRKLPKEARFFEAVFRRRHRRYAGVAWVAINRLRQAESARILGESEVFLSLSHRESFGLPPLEAMACGCLVAGLHGEGGLEYATNENGWWAETGDWKTVVDGLAVALDLLETGGDALEARWRAMAETVDSYSPAKLEKELLAFWHRELEGSTERDPATIDDAAGNGVLSVEFDP